MLIAKNFDILRIDFPGVFLGENWFAWLAKFLLESASLFLTADLLVLVETGVCNLVPSSTNNKLVTFVSFTFDSLLFKLVYFINDGSTYSSAMNFWTHWEFSWMTEISYLLWYHYLKFHWDRHCAF